MADFSKYFSLYEPTDDPPVVTSGYKKVKKDYFDFINSSFKYPEMDDENEVEDETEDEWTWNPIYNTVQNNVNPLNHSNEIINYFLKKGLSLNQAKGIYGNIMLESNGNIEATSRDGHSSYGIAQWTGPRKLKLFEMYGTSPTLNDQLDFLWWELNNTHSSALSKLRETSSIEDAVRVFMDEFEKPNKKHANLNRRLNFAFSI